MDPASNQIEYDKEDPIVRETFEKRLKENGLTSLMPDECYRIPGYEWEYGSGDRKVGNKPTYTVSWLPISAVVTGPGGRSTSNTNYSDAGCGTTAIPFTLSR